MSIGACLKDHRSSLCGWSRKIEYIRLIFTKRTFTFYDVRILTSLSKSVKRRKKIENKSLNRNIDSKTRSEKAGKTEPDAYLDFMDLKELEAFVVAFLPVLKVDENNPKDPKKDSKYLIGTDKKSL